MAKFGEQTFRHSKLLAHAEIQVEGPGPKMKVGEMLEIGDVASRKNRGRELSLRIWLNCQVRFEPLEG